MESNQVNWHEEVMSRKEELVKDLKGLLEIQSIKDVESKTNKRPMGQKIGEALEHMLHLSAAEGFTTKNIEGNAGYAELGDASDHVGVLCHIDVVPAPGNWDSPPFEPAIRNGKLYARGAIDDKGPTMAAFYALKILKKLNLPMKNNIRLIFGTDEESGMRCMKKYQEIVGIPEMGFAPDAVFPIIHAEKGQINAKLRMKKSEKNGETPSVELLHFSAGEKGNMVPGQATAKVKVDGPSDISSKFKQYAKEKGLKVSVTSEDTVITLELEGKTVHGMEPYNGVNAGLELARFLTHFPFENKGQTFLKFCGQQLYRDFYGENLGIRFSDEVTGDLTVNAGILRFDHNEEGTVQLNIRCPVETHYLRTIEILMEKSEASGFEVDEIRKKQPHHVSQNHPMIQSMQKAYRAETGEEPELLSTGGATYARFIENGVAFGAVFPGKEMSAHQVNEYIEIDDLLKATAIYARTLYELANL